MSCYICDHSIVAICERCGSELTVCDSRQVETMRDAGTEVRIVPCDCEPRDTAEKDIALRR